MKKLSPEEQNKLIKRMTSEWKKDPNPMPHGKVVPLWCEHCDEKMTATGRLPALRDRDSWANWVGVTVGEHGVRKAHHTSVISGYGFCCVPCFKAFQQWDKEYAAEGGERW